MKSKHREGGKSDRYQKGNIETILEDAMIGLGRAKLLSAVGAQCHRTLKMLRY